MNTKINHPFKAPDRFFDSFRTNLEEQIIKQPARIRPLLAHKIRNYMRYAAIAFLFFGLGYTAFWLTNKNRGPLSDNENLTVEEIYTIVPEDEMTDFVLENFTTENLEQIKF